MFSNLTRKVILNYHNVAPGFQVGINRVHPSIFYNHIGVIERAIDDDVNLDIAITFDDGYEDIFTYAMPIIENSKIDNISMFIITDHIGALNTWDYSFIFNRYKHLNDKQIKILSEMKWNIGSHGESHKPFFEMDNKTLSHELGNSKKRIEDITEKAVDSVAPPFGRLDQRVYDECCRAGYKKVYVHVSSDINLTDDSIHSKIDFSS